MLYVEGKGKELEKEGSINGLTEEGLEEGRAEKEMELEKEVKKLRRLNKEEIEEYKERLKQTQESRQAEVEALNLEKEVVLREIHDLERKLMSKFVVDDLELRGMVEKIELLEFLSRELKRNEREKYLYEKLISRGEKIKDWKERRELGCKETKEKEEEKEEGLEEEIEIEIEEEEEGRRIKRGGYGGLREQDRKDLIINESEERVLTIWKEKEKLLELKEEILKKEEEEVASEEKTKELMVVERLFEGCGRQVRNDLCEDGIIYQETVKQALENERLRMEQRGKELEKEGSERALESEILVKKLNKVEEQETVLKLSEELVRKERKKLENVTKEMSIKKIDIYGNNEYEREVGYTVGGYQKRLELNIETLVYLIKRIDELKRLEGSGRGLVAQKRILELKKEINSHLVSVSTEIEEEGIKAEGMSIFALNRQEEAKKQAKIEEEMVKKLEGNETFRGRFKGGTRRVENVENVKKEELRVEIGERERKFEEEVKGLKEEAKRYEEKIKGCEKYKIFIDEETEEIKEKRKEIESLEDIATRVRIGEVPKKEEILEILNKGTVSDLKESRKLLLMERADYEYEYEVLRRLKAIIEGDNDLKEGRYGSEKVEEKTVDMITEDLGIGQDAGMSEIEGGGCEIRELKEKGKEVLMLMLENAGITLINEVMNRKDARASEVEQIKREIEEIGRRYGLEVEDEGIWLDSLVLDFEEGKIKCEGDDTKVLKKMENKEQIKRLKEEIEEKEVRLLSKGYSWVRQDDKGVLRGWLRRKELTIEYAQEGRKQISSSDIKELTNKMEEIEQYEEELKSDINDLEKKIREEKRLNEEAAQKIEHLLKSPEWSEKLNQLSSDEKFKWVPAKYQCELNKRRLELLLKKKELATRERIEERVLLYGEGERRHLCDQVDRLRREVELSNKMVGELTRLGFHQERKKMELEEEKLILQERSCKSGMRLQEVRIKRMKLLEAKEALEKQIKLMDLSLRATRKAEEFDMELFVSDIEDSLDTERKARGARIGRLRLNLECQKRSVENYGKEDKDFMEKKEGFISVLTANMNEIEAKKKEIVLRERNIEELTLQFERIGAVTEEINRKLSIYSAHMAKNQRFDFGYNCVDMDKMIDDTELAIESLESGRIVECCIKLDEVSKKYSEEYGELKRKVELKEGNELEIIDRGAVLEIVSELGNQVEKLQEADIFEAACCEQDILCITSRIKKLELLKQDAVKQGVMGEISRLVWNLYTGMEGLSIELSRHFEDVSKAYGEYCDHNIAVINKFYETEQIEKFDFVTDESFKILLELNGLHEGYRKTLEVYKKEIGELSEIALKYKKLGEGKDSEEERLGRAREYGKDLLLLSEMVSQGKKSEGMGGEGSEKYISKLLSMISEYKDLDDKKDGLKNREEEKREQIVMLEKRMEEIEGRIKERGSEVKDGELGVSEEREGREKGLEEEILELGRKRDGVEEEKRKEREERERIENEIEGLLNKIKEYEDNEREGAGEEGRDESEVDPYKSLANVCERILAEKRKEAALLEETVGKSRELIVEGMEKVSSFLGKDINAEEDRGEIRSLVRMIESSMKDVCESERGDLVSEELETELLNLKTALELKKEERRQIASGRTKMRSEIYNLTVEKVGLEHHIGCKKRELEELKNIRLLLPRMEEELERMCAGIVLSSSRGREINKQLVLDEVKKLACEYGQVEWKVRGHEISDEERENIRRIGALNKEVKRLSEEREEAYGDLYGVKTDIKQTCEMITRLQVESETLESFIITKKDTLRSVQSKYEFTESEFKWCEETLEAITEEFPGSSYGKDEKESDKKRATKERLLADCMKHGIIKEGEKGVRIGEAKQRVKNARSRYEQALRNEGGLIEIEIINGEEMSKRLEDMKEETAALQKKSSLLQSSVISKHEIIKGIESKLSSYEKEIMEAQEVQEMFEEAHELVPFERVIYVLLMRKLQDKLGVAGKRILELRGKRQEIYQAMKADIFAREQENEDLCKVRHDWKDFVNRVRELRNFEKQSEKYDTWEAVGIINGLKSSIKAEELYSFEEEGAASEVEGEREGAPRDSWSEGVLRGRLLKLGREEELAKRKICDLDREIKESEKSRATDATKLEKWEISSANMAFEISVTENEQETLAKKLAYAEAEIVRLRDALGVNTIKSGILIDKSEKLTSNVFENANQKYELVSSSKEGEGITKEQSGIIATRVKEIDQKHEALQLEINLVNTKISDLDDEAVEIFKSIGLKMHEKSDLAIAISIHESNMESKIRQAKNIHERVESLRTRVIGHQSEARLLERQRRYEELRLDRICEERNRITNSLSELTGRKYEEEVMDFRVKGSSNTLLGIVENMIDVYEEEIMEFWYRQHTEITCENINRALARFRRVSFGVCQGVEVLSTKSAEVEDMEETKSLEVEDMEEGIGTAGEGTVGVDAVVGRAKPMEMKFDDHISGYMDFELKTGLVVIIESDLVRLKELQISRKKEGLGFMSKGISTELGFLLLVDKLWRANPSCIFDVKEFKADERKELEKQLNIRNGILIMRADLDSKVLKVDVRTSDNVRLLKKYKQERINLNKQIKEAEDSIYGMLSDSVERLGIDLMRACYFSNETLEDIENLYKDALMKVGEFVESEHSLLSGSVSHLVDAEDVYSCKHFQEYKEVEILCRKVRLLVMGLRLSASESLQRVLASNRMEWGEKEDRLEVSAAQGLKEHLLSILSRIIDVDEHKLAQIERIKLERSRKDVLLNSDNMYTNNLKGDVLPSRGHSKDNNLDKYEASLVEKVNNFTKWVSVVHSMDMKDPNHRAVLLSMLSSDKVLIADELVARRVRIESLDKDSKDARIISDDYALYCDTLMQRLVESDPDQELLKINKGASVFFRRRMTAKTLVQKKQTVIDSEDVAHEVSEDDEVDSLDTTLQSSQLNEQSTQVSEPATQVSEPSTQVSATSILQVGKGTPLSKVASLVVSQLNTSLKFHTLSDSESSSESEEEVDSAQTEELKQRDSGGAMSNGGGGLTSMRGAMSNGGLTSMRGGGLASLRALESGLDPTESIGGSRMNSSSFLMDPMAVTEEFYYEDVEVTRSRIELAQAIGMDSFGSRTVAKSRKARKAPVVPIEMNSIIHADDLPAGLEGSLNMSVNGMGMRSGMGRSGMDRSGMGVSGFGFSGRSNNRSTTMGTGMPSAKLVDVTHRSGLTPSGTISKPSVSVMTPSGMTSTIRGGRGGASFMSSRGGGTSTRGRGMPSSHRGRQAGNLQDSTLGGSFVMTPRSELGSSRVSQGIRGKGKSHLGQQQK